MHSKQSEKVLAAIAAVLFLIGTYGLFLGTCALLVVMGWAA